MAAAASSLIVDKSSIDVPPIWKENNFCISITGISQKLKTRISEAAGAVIRQNSPLLDLKNYKENSADVCNLIDNTISQIKKIKEIEDLQFEECLDSPPTQEDCSKKINIEDNIYQFVIGNFFRVVVENENKEAVLNIAKHWYSQESLGIYLPILDKLAPHGFNYTAFFAKMHIESKKAQDHLKALLHAKEFSKISFNWVEIASIQSMFLLSSYLAYSIENTPFKIAFGLISTFLIYSSFKWIKDLKNISKILESNLLRKEDDPTKENALILMPTKKSDYNQAFASVYIHELPMLAKKYNIDLFYPSSTDAVKSYINFKKYAHVLMCGHGDPKSITFSSFYKLSSEDIRKLKFDTLTDEATIALISCFTGEKDGLQESIAKESSKLVVAPKEASNDWKIDISKKSPQYSFYLDEPWQIGKKDITRVIPPNNKL